MRRTHTLWDAAAADDDDDDDDEEEEEDWKRRRREAGCMSLRDTRVGRIFR